MASNDPDRQSSSPSFADFRAAAFSIAGTIALVGLVGLALSGLIPEGPVQRVVSNLAAVVFVIGVVQIVWDAWLHTRLTQGFLNEVKASEAAMTATITSRFDEIRRSLETDQRLLPSGIRSVEWSRTDWSVLLAESPSVLLLPVDLTSWMLNEWTAVLDLARARQLKVDLYLPNIDGAGQEAHCVHLSQNATRLSDDLKNTIEAIRDRWTDGTISDGSVLSVYTYDRPAGYGLVVGTSGWALALPPAGGPQADEYTVVIGMKGGADPGFLEWARRQAVDLQSQLFDEWTA